MNEATEPSAVAEAAIEDRVAAMMSGEPKPQPKTPQTPEPQQPTGQDGNSGDLTETENAPAGDEAASGPEVAQDEPQASAFEIEAVWNGQPLKITDKAQAKDLIEKGYDYTQKAQRVADEYRAVQRMGQAVQAQAQLHPAVFEAKATTKAIELELAQYQQVDWEKLAQDDPLGVAQVQARFQKAQQRWQQAKAQEDQVSQQFAQASQQAQREWVGMQFQQAFKAVPAWKDPKALEKDKQGIVNYLREINLFAPEELQNIVDPRQLVVLRDAAAYRALAKSGSLKKLNDLPPVAKPGVQVTRNEQKAQAKTELKRQIKSTDDPRKQEQLLTRLFMDKL